MRISYDKLWKLLIDKRMRKGDLIDVVGMGRATLTKMNKEQSISMDTIIRICKYFHCDVSDILEFVHEDEEN